MTPSDEVADRRQRAREAGQDAWADAVAVPSVGDRAANAIDDAIESAIRVRVDDTLVTIAHGAARAPFTDRAEAKRIIENAFRAAGFEIEE